MFGSKYLAIESRPKIRITNDRGVNIAKYNTERMILVLIHPRHRPISIHTRKGCRRAAGRTTAGRASNALKMTDHTRTFCPRKTHGHSPMTANPVAMMKPKERNCRGSFGSGICRASLSVQDKFFSPFAVFNQRLLPLLFANKIFEDEDIHFRSHKAAVRVLG
jgi:hypothetical protein